MGRQVPRTRDRAAGDNVTIVLHGETAITKKGRPDLDVQRGARRALLELRTEAARRALLGPHRQRGQPLQGQHLDDADRTRRPGRRRDQPETKIKVTGCPKKKVNKHKTKGKREGKKK